MVHYRVRVGIFIVSLLALSLLLVGISQAAEPVNAITWPWSGSTVDGVVEIKGTAAVVPAGRTFSYYKVEYGAGADPKTWVLVSGVTKGAPVTDGVLDTWDTTKVPEGVYVLRLSVVDNTGNFLTARTTVKVVKGATKVGADTCKTCHTSKHDAWSKTKHAATKVECETCHGAGSAHVAAKGNTDKIGLVYSPELCGTCHKAYLSEWKTSAHPTVNAMMAFNAACVACHTGQGYVEVIIGGSKTFKPVAEPVGTVCVACHTPHSAQNPGQLRAVGTVKLPTGQEVKEGLAANCAKCHNQRRDAANIRTQIEKTWARGPHEGTSADMLAGVGAWEYPGIKYTSSAHSKLPDACITCHMPKKADGKTSHDFKPSLAACQSCHPGLTTFNVKAKGDYDGDGKIEGVQDEVEGLLALLEAKLPTLEYPAAVQALKTPAQRAAAYNTLFVEHDWSKGIHNTSYAVQLLQSAYKDLTGTDVPGATLLIPAGPSAGTLPPAALPKTGEIPTLPIVLILLVGSLAVLAGSMVRRRA